jgi:hypothetical protein
LRGEAFDVTTHYVSKAAHRKAVRQGRDIIPKSKRSGWVVETTPSELGHLWVCGLCHPPVAGLDVEWRDAAPPREPGLADALRFAREWNTAVGRRRRVKPQPQLTSGPAPVEVGEKPAA